MQRLFAPKQNDPVGAFFKIIFYTNFLLFIYFIYNLFSC